ncbi:GNAT family N-acetyltransferase [Pontibacter korlensis]|uniref:GNAT family N-acetyltransferase n=1 Tax=Pontibacter korlensis TaxID=400092 RepID=UPI00130E63B9|nr:GNAT family N-acetyltransferase [Pontibacter korlensis]
MDKIGAHDANFIFELVNLPDWKRFNGDRNVTSRAAAEVYIEGMVTNPDTECWVVRLKQEKPPVGIITFIKREYLQHPYIGFTFLPEYRSQGYAYEATGTVLEEVKLNTAFTHVHATVLKENQKSIYLLEKLGLRYEKNVRVKNDELLLYTIALSVYN